MKSNCPLSRENVKIDVPGEMAVNVAERNDVTDVRSDSNMSSADPTAHGSLLEARTSSWFNPTQQAHSGPAHVSLVDNTM